MRKDTFSGASTIISLLVLVIIILTLVIGSLYSQNKSYQFENRGLILQNDSVLSVNAELKGIVNSMLNQVENRTTTTKYTKQ